jgi:hypothetical protein
VFSVQPTLSNVHWLELNVHPVLYMTSHWTSVPASETSLERTEPTLVAAALPAMERGPVLPGELLDNTHIDHYQRTLKDFQR